MKEIPFKDFLDHIALPNCSAVPDGKNLVLMEIGEDGEHGDFWMPTPVQYAPSEKSLFYFFARVDEEMVFAWIYFIGFKEDAEKFTYTINVSTSSKWCIKFTGPVKSIFESPNDICEKFDTFMIGLQLGKKLCKEEKKLAFEFSVMDDKAEARS